MGGRVIQWKGTECSSHLGPLYKTGIERGVTGISCYFQRDLATLACSILKSLLTICI